MPDSETAAPAPSILETARTMMVDSQVRPNKVVDPRVIDAMRRLPREAFLPPELAERAYCDEDVALGRGRVMPEPMMIARLVQIAAIRRGERVLVVGAGTGYASAVLAACGASVIALEDDAELIRIAKAALAAQAPGVALVEAPLALGWQQGAPDDCVLVEGAVEVLPPAIADQVSSTGRLVMIRRQGGRMGQAVIGRPVSTSNGRQTLSFTVVFDCAVPSLPAMRRTAAFVF